MISSPFESKNKHVLDAAEPEECLVLLQQYFVDMLEPIMNPCAELLAEYLYNCPKEPVEKAYRHYKNALKCICYKNKYIFASSVLFFIIICCL